MDAAIFDCPMEWVRFFPPGVCPIRRDRELTEHIWPLLALTPEGCQALAESQAASGKSPAVSCWLPENSRPFLPASRRRR